MESQSSRDSSSRAATQEYPNPFIHELKLTKAQWIKGIILGCTLLPIRVFLAWILLIAAWIVAVLRLAGLSQEERSKPLSGWRRWLFHPILWLLGRAVFFCVGFHWVKVKGRKVDVKEAPILVVAPHSSFLDMVIMFPAGVPAVVSRSENINLPVIGGEERERGNLFTLPSFIHLEAPVGSLKSFKKKYPDGSCWCFSVLLTETQFTFYRLSYHLGPFLRSSLHLRYRQDVHLLCSNIWSKQ